LKTNDFKVGDSVITIKDNLSGVITKVDNDHLIIELSDSGLNTKVLFSEIIRENQYLDMSQYSFNINKSEKKKKIIKDLHHEKISNNSSLSISEILRKQILIIHDTIENAFLSQYDEIEIIFIHGLGSGRLKSELHNILTEKCLKYHEVNGGVATSVLI
tara:strand:- start:120 stop:596 length:477 start_codon:yes stop_codon:yes gene_type:complete